MDCAYGMLSSYASQEFICQGIRRNPDRRRNGYPETWVYTRFATSLYLQIIQMFTQKLLYLASFRSRSSEVGLEMSKN
jgi:hypothetical protein